MVNGEKMKGVNRKDHKEHKEIENGMNVKSVSRKDAEPQRKMGMIGV